MGWSYADYLATPEPVLDAVLELMKAEADRERERMREIERQRHKR